MTIKYVCDERVRDRYRRILCILADRQERTRYPDLAADPRWPWTLKTMANDLRDLADIGIVARSGMSPGQMRAALTPYGRAATLDEVVALMSSEQSIRNRRQPRQEGRR